MEKAFLEECLRDGLSLDQIAKSVGRHPSTASHHLHKHGLRANGANRHAPNGKVDPEVLRALIDGGASIHAAAAELGVAYSTVRYWVRRQGLETDRMKRSKASREAARDGARDLRLACPVHGVGAFHVRPEGGFRCNRCRSEAVSKWRRRVKMRLVEQAGGGCELCGYNRHQNALQFHHVDPASKRFALSRQGVTRSFAEACAEADTCVLLCANCHAEVEAGVAEIPSELLAVKLEAVERIPK